MENQNKLQVLVCGAGTMGNGIAHLFAQNQHSVLLFDASTEALERGLNTISTNLDRQVKKGGITSDDKSNILSRITCLNVIEKHDKVELVIEAVPEVEEIKRTVWKSLDAHLSPECIFASNTSSISISKLAENCSYPERFIGMHFMNPVPIMPLVEVIPGEKTAQSTLKKITELTTSLGKTPIISQDRPGFIANRILMPMINEAIWALSEGVGTAEGIDTVMKLGMSHPMGPLQLADYIGLDTCLSIMHVLHEGFLDPKYAPCPLLIEMVQSGALGKKSGKGFYKYDGS
jgi:3-hydroxybutyryl-CoA dehydrogenase